MNFLNAVPTHAGENVRRFIFGLSAHAKWLLSGTPPLHCFADIKSMAELIGVHLGIDDFSSLPADDYSQVLTNKLGKLTALKICRLCNANLFDRHREIYVVSTSPFPILGQETRRVGATIS